MLCGVSCEEHQHTIEFGRVVGFSLFFVAERGGRAGANVGGQSIDSFSILKSLLLDIIIPRVREASRMKEMFAGHGWVTLSFPSSRFCRRLQLSRDPTGQGSKHYSSKGVAVDLWVIVSTAQWWSKHVHPTHLATPRHFLLRQNYATTFSCLDLPIHRVGGLFSCNSV